MAVSANALTAPVSAFPLLRETELRRYLTEGQLQELESYCRASIRKAGVTLLRQGGPAETFYIVVEGSVELRARPPGRRVYRTIEVVRPTCSFGDEAVFDVGTYLASARTLERTELLALPRPGFDRLARLHPAIANGVLRCAGACLIQTVRRSAILTQSPAEVSVRMLLRELAQASQRADRRLASLRITHAQLAGVLHLSRETVSRILGQMEAEGTVELGRGVLRLRDA
jgi:CRP/FNR family cyclic AMP-dependent transcriptional regulator